MKSKTLSYFLNTLHTSLPSPSKILTPILLQISPKNGVKPWKLNRQHYFNNRQALIATSNNETLESSPVKVFFRTIETAN